MSKPAKNLKKRLKAPRALVEATKKGERFVPAHRADTRDVHIRRFTKVIAVYACAAVLLIAGVAILPLLWKGNAPITAQSGTVITSAVTNQPAYVAPTEDEARGFIRPDLIWASSLNPDLKDVVIWIAELGDDGIQVVQSASFPDVGIENARYAVDVKLEYLESDDDDANQISQQRMKRDLAKLTGALQSVGIEPLKNQYGYDLGYRGNFANDPGNNYLLKYFEIGADQLTEEDERAILSNYESFTLNFRIEIKIAWQPND